MTAEEYAIKNMHDADLNEIETALIDFAKLKCKELLEVVAEKAESYVIGGLVSQVDKDSILNAVDLDEFIK